MGVWLMRCQGKKGFTLMEMLIVVAIVAILVAISIPVFATTLDKTREATCAANRRGLQGLLVATYLVDGADHLQTAFTTAKEDGKEFTCPAGGEISYIYEPDYSTINTYCSEHRPSRPTDGRGWTNLLATGTFNIKNRNLTGTYATIQEYLAAFLANRNKTQNRETIATIDSCAPATDGTPIAAQINKILDNEVGSWRVYYKDVGFDGWIDAGTDDQLNYFWTDVDISTMEKDETFTVTKYDAVQDKYYTGTAKVGTKTVGSEYKVINVDRVDWIEIKD